MAEKKVTKSDKVKSWMKRHNVAADQPWFDKNTTYYNLTIQQIISVANYLNKL